MSNAPLCWRIYFITQSKQRDPSNINTERLPISSSVLQPGQAGSTEMALISAWVLLGFFGGRVNQNERLRKLLSWHRLSASWCSLFKSPQRITLLKVFLLCCIRIHHWTAKKPPPCVCCPLQSAANRSGYSPSGRRCPVRQLWTLKDLICKSMHKQLVSISVTQTVWVGTVVIHPQLQRWELFSLFIHQMCGLPPSCLSVPAPVYTLLLSAAQTELSQANPF